MRRVDSREAHWRAAAGTPRPYPGTVVAGDAALRSSGPWSSSDCHWTGKCCNEYGSRSRDTGAVGLVLFPLARLAIADLSAGNWAGAVANATEALQLARSTGQPPDRDAAGPVGPVCRVARRRRLRTGAGRTEPGHHRAALRHSRRPRRGHQTVGAGISRRLHRAAGGRRPHCITSSR